MDVFDRDEVREVLEAGFYAPDPPRRSKTKKPSPEPDELPYKVICISLYREDLERLDEKVKQLKRQGHRKMSRSALIRYALDTADLDGLPKGY
ncbi:MAG: hypothetical protein AB7S26_26660 [Sandaracinaceae bacterium]